jgi:hypothetical protein
LTNGINSGQKKKKELNQYAKCSLKRNGMKSLLGLNISLENTLDILDRRWGFKAFNFQSELLGFWTLSIVQYSKKLDNTMFWKLDLFPSSGEQALSD